MEHREILDAIEGSHNTARTLAVRFGITVSEAAKAVAGLPRGLITTEWRPVKDQWNIQELVYKIVEGTCRSIGTANTAEGSSSTKTQTIHIAADLVVSGQEGSKPSTTIDKASKNLGRKMITLEDLP